MQSPRNLIQITIAAFVTLLLTGACSLSDIRPSYLIDKGKTKAGEKKARALLAEMEKAHGGADVWRSKKNIRIVFRDEWPSWILRTVAMPWGKNTQQLQLDWQVGSDNSRLEFLEAPGKGEVWGIQQWATYNRAEGKSELEFDQDEDIKFWLPTMQYFAESPFRLNQGAVVYYAGEKETGGQTYDLVFISWKTDEPQSGIDQYVAWINRNSKRLDYLQYTVRDMMPHMKSTMRFTEYENFDGLVLAKRFTVIEEPGQSSPDFTHEMVVEAVKFDLDLPDKHFIPDPAKHLAK